MRATWCHVTGCLFYLPKLRMALWKGCSFILPLGWGASALRPNGSEHDKRDTGSVLSYLYIYGGVVSGIEERRKKIREQQKRNRDQAKSDKKFDPKKIRVLIKKK